MERQRCQMHSQSSIISTVVGEMKIKIIIRFILCKLMRAIFRSSYINQNSSSSIRIASLKAKTLSHKMATLAMHIHSYLSIHSCETSK